MRLSKKVALNASAQVMGQAVGAVSGLVSIAIATRYLTLDSYGQIIAAMALVSMFGVAGDFGMSAVGARFLARAPDNEERLAAAMLWAGLVLTALPVALIWTVSEIAYAGPANELSRQAVLVLLATFLLNPLRGVAQAFAVARQRMYLVAVCGVLARFTSLALVALFAAADAGPVAIAAAYAAGGLVDDAAAIILLRGHLKLKLRVSTTEVRALLSAATPLGLVLVLNALYFKLDVFLLALLSTDADVALYGVAYRIFDMLVPLPGYVMVTLLPELARLEPRDTRFRELVDQAFNGMWLLTLPLAALALCAPEILGLIAGGAYEDGATTLVLIMLSLALASLNGVFGNTLVSQGRQAALLKVSGAVLVVNIALNLALIPPYGVEGAGVALLASEALSLSGTVAVYARIAAIPRPYRMTRTLVAVVAMAGAISVKYAFEAGPVLTLVVAGTTGVLVYLTVLWALRAVPPPVVRALRRRARVASAS